MIHVEIPGFGDHSWTLLLLDLNGTLTTDGVLIAGVAERLQRLTSQLEIRFCTSDTRGVAKMLAQRLGVSVLRIERGQEAQQKRAAVEKVGGERVIAIGNGANDAGMLDAAGLGIAIVGREGAASRAVLAADIIVTDVCDALDLLLDPVRLLSTLRF